MSQHRSYTPEDRVQIIALAVHRITDRFSAQDEAFGDRMRNAAIDLIEDVSRYNFIRTRDAAGMVRLVHEIIRKSAALTALLGFVKNRGLVAPATVDMVLWHLTQFIQHFQLEDRKLEEHVATQHPHGMIVEMSPRNLESSPLPAVSPAPAQHRLGAFDELLGPDSYTETPAQIKQGSSSQRSAPSPFPSLASADAVGRSDGNGQANGRQRRILDFFILRRRAQLKEVLKLFPGLSEKTVRNDLAQLCREGRLKRVGLPPRSHYTLAA